MPETFKTLLRNGRKKAVTIYESDGTPLVTLEPKRAIFDKDGTRKTLPAQEFLLETEDPLATFARWTEVEFVNGPQWTKLSQRTGWIEPDHGKWPCEFINLQGNRDPEYRTLHHMTICLMRGLPVVAGLDLMDDYITYDRIEVGKPVLKRKPSTEFDGIVEVHWDFEDDRHLRGQDDLLTIQREIEALAEPKKTHAPDDVEFS